MRTILLALLGVIVICFIVDMAFEAGRASMRRQLTPYVILAEGHIEFLAQQVPSDPALDAKLEELLEARKGALQ